MVSSIDSIMYNLNQLNDKNAKVTYSMSSNKALEYGSDDAIKYDQILSIQNNISTYSSISERIEYSSAFNTSSDSVLSEIKTLTESILANVIQANTDTTSAENKEVIATEIESYKESLFNLANNSTNNEYLFSGVNTQTQAFEMDDTTGQVSYKSDNSVKTLNVENNVYTKQGVNGIDVFYYEKENIESTNSFTFSENEIILDEEGNQWSLVDSDSDGTYDGLFLNGDTSSSSLAITDNADGTYLATNTTSNSLSVNHSIFDLLDEIVDSLNQVDSNGNAISEDDANTILSSSLESLNEAYDSINMAHSLVGTRTSIIDNYSDYVESKLTNLKILEEDYASADLTALAVEAQALENTYTALYSTINRVNSLSLVNFLN